MTLDKLSQGVIKEIRPHHFSAAGPGEQAKTMLIISSLPRYGQRLVIQSLSGNEVADFLRAHMAPRSRAWMQTQKGAISEQQEQIKWKSVNY